jgi:hypothetical protein
MDMTPNQRSIGGDEEPDIKEPKMFTSPDTVFEMAKLHQQELIAEADRARLLARARRGRTKRPERSHR